jgi:hypothetical protein
MATTSYQTQLESVQAAIAKIESGGQSYTISTSTGTRQVTRADLDLLYKREVELRRKVANATSGGRRVFGGTPVSNA